MGEYFPHGDTCHYVNIEDTYKLSKISSSFNIGSSAVKIACSISVIIWVLWQGHEKLTSCRERWKKHKKDMCNLLNESALLLWFTPKNLQEFYIKVSFSSILNLFIRHLSNRLLTKRIVLSKFIVILKVYAAFNQDDVY